MIFFLCFTMLWARPTLEMATRYWREGDVSSTISSLEQVVYQMPTLRSEGIQFVFLLGMPMQKRRLWFGGTSV